MLRRPMTLNGVGSVGQHALDVDARIGGKRKAVDELLGHVLPPLVVPEEEAEDRPQEDEERHDREEDVVRDRGRDLRVAMSGVAGDRGRHRPHDPADGRSLDGVRVAGSRNRRHAHGRAPSRPARPPG